MSENRCFYTAERIQIMTMNKCKRDLNNNYLRSTYNYRYLIRLFSKTIWFNSINLQFAPCLWSNAKSRQVSGPETKGDNNVKKAYYTGMFLGDCPPKLLKPFRSVEQNGRQGYK